MIKMARDLVVIRFAYVIGVWRRQEPSKSYSSSSSTVVVVVVVVLLEALVHLCWQNNSSRNPRSIYQPSAVWFVIAFVVAVVGGTLPLSFL